MTSYAMRITRTSEELAGLWERLAGSTLRIIAYEHRDGARPHCHVYAEGVAVSTDTIKNWIKRALSVKTFPKEDWSFKGADGDLKIITYMSKGTLDPIYNKGFEPDQVNTLKGNWLDYATLLRSQHPKKPVSPTLKWAEMLDIAEKRFLEQEKQADGIDRVLEVAISISKRVVYIENKALVGRHKFRDFVDTVIARVFDGYQWGRLQNDFMRYRT